MGSLRDNDFANSPSMVLPPPNIHSFYASTHSHCIPYYQYRKPVAHPPTAPPALGGPSRKRSRESLDEAPALSGPKLPRTCPEAANHDTKGPGHPRGEADAMLEGQAEGKADQDVEMSGRETLDAPSFTAEDDSGDPVAQRSSSNNAALKQTGCSNSLS
ncbi:MAG: hypothetical protein LQ339_002053 [Xanthoria mediterranea]|nr:MAG: hypothetical protein LQ339_002053 [Xanthoria mediterranea]